MKHFLPPLLLGLGLISAGAQADDLMNSYRLALDSDPRLRQAEANRRAVMETKPQARAALLPTVSLTADSTWNDQEFKGFAAFGEDQAYNSHGYTVSLLQPVFNYPSWIQLRQAGSQIAQAEAEYVVAQQDLMLRVADGYFGVLSAKDDLEAARAEKSAVGRQLEQVQQRFEVGLVAITDVHEAQARYDETVAGVIGAQNELDIAQERLREVTGAFEDSPSTLKDEIPLASPEPADMAAWVKTALDQNPQLLAVRYASETAREEINRQRAGHLPTVDLVAQTSQNKTGGGRLGGGTTDADTIGLELNVPIYLGGSVVSRTREASYRFDEATSTVEEQSRSITRQAREAYLNVVSFINRIKALKQAVVSAESALEATQAGFEVGTRTIVDVLDSQRVVTLSRVNFLRRRYDYLVETLRLKQAAGILQVNDLERVNTLLQ